MTTDDMERVVRDFGAAPERSLQAGFEVVEVHAAHGYLLHEFLSPLSNRRTDEYGGAFENRARLLLRVARQTRELWPARWPVFVRISATDWTDGGWDLEQSVRLAGLVQEVGIDLIDCSSGGNGPRAKIPGGPGDQVPFAGEIRQRTGIATRAVGGITQPPQGQALVSG